MRHLLHFRPFLLRYLLRCQNLSVPWINYNLMELHSRSAKNYCIYQVSTMSPPNSANANELLPTDCSAECLMQYGFHFLVRKRYSSLSLSCGSVMDPCLSMRSILCLSRFIIFPTLLPSL